MTTHQLSSPVHRRFVPVRKSLAGSARRGGAGPSDLPAVTAVLVLLLAGSWSALTTDGAPRSAAYLVMAAMAARLAWLMRPSRARRRDAPYLVLPGVLTTGRLVVCGLGEHPVWLVAARGAGAHRGAPRNCGEPTLRGHRSNGGLRCRP